MSRPKGACQIGQIGLIEAIGKYLKKQKVTGLNTRQFNAIIFAADHVLREMEQPHRGVTMNMGLAAWHSSDETGRSSLFLSYALEGRGDGYMVTYPIDPDDFGRCLGLLVACPNLRAKLPFLTGIGPQWDALIGAWPELEALWNEESPSGTCPKLYARMQGLLAGVKEGE